MEVDETKKTTPQLPGCFMGSSLTRLEELAVGSGALSTPDAIEDAGASRVADFGEALDLEKKAAEIELPNLAGREVVGEKIIHQDAVMQTKKARGTEYEYWRRCRQGTLS
jgi:hypothetical protein